MFSRGLKALTSFSLESTRVITSYKGLKVCQILMGSISSLTGFTGSKGLPLCFPCGLKLSSGSHWSFRPLQVSSGAYNLHQGLTVAKGLLQILTTIKRLPQILISS